MTIGLIIHLTGKVKEEAGLNQTAMKYAKFVDLTGSYTFIILKKLAKVAHAY